MLYAYLGNGTNLKKWPLSILVEPYKSATMCNPDHIGESEEFCFIYLFFVFVFVYLFIYFFMFYFWLLLMLWIFSSNVGDSVLLPIHTV